MASFGPIGSAACNRCEYSPKPKRKPWIPADWQLGPWPGPWHYGKHSKPTGGAAVPAPAVRGSRFAVSGSRERREERLSLRGAVRRTCRPRRPRSSPPPRRSPPPAADPVATPVTCRSPVGHPPPIVAICLILVPKYRTPAQFHAAPARNDHWRSLEVATGWPSRPATSSSAVQACDESDVLVRSTTPQASAQSFRRKRLHAAAQDRLTRSRHRRVALDQRQRGRVQLMVLARPWPRTRPTGPPLPPVPRRAMHPDPTVCGRG